MEEIVIVGAGPTGLWLAAELRLQGTSVTVLEVRRERDPHSRALTIHPRTLEILGMRGLADDFIAMRPPAAHRPLRGPGNTAGLQRPGDALPLHPVSAPGAHRGAAGGTRARTRRADPSRTPGDGAGAGRGSRPRRGGGTRGPVPAGSAVRRGMRRHPQPGPGSRGDRLSRHRHVGVGMAGRCRPRPAARRPGQRVRPGWWRDGGAHDGRPDPPRRRRPGRPPERPPRRTDPGGSAGEDGTGPGHRLRNARPLLALPLRERHPAGRRLPRGPGPPGGRRRACTSRPAASG